MIVIHHGVHLELEACWREEAVGPGARGFRSTASGSFLLVFDPQPGTLALADHFDAWVLANRGRRRSDDEVPVRLETGPRGALALPHVVEGIAQVRWLVLVDGRDRVPMIAASHLPPADARRELEAILATLRPAAGTSPFEPWAG